MFTEQPIALLQQASEATNNPSSSIAQARLEIVAAQLATQGGR